MVLKEKKIDLKSSILMVYLQRLPYRVKQSNVWPSLWTVLLSLWSSLKSRDLAPFVPCSWLGHLKRSPKSILSEEILSHGGSLAHWPSREGVVAGGGGSEWFVRSNVRRRIYALPPPLLTGPPCVINTQKRHPVLILTVFELNFDPSASMASCKWM